LVDGWIAVTFVDRRRWHCSNSSGACRCAAPKMFLFLSNDDTTNPHHKFTNRKMLHSNNPASRWARDIVRRRKIYPSEIESSDCSSFLDVPIRSNRTSRYRRSATASLTTSTVPRPLPSRSTSHHQPSKCVALRRGDEKITKIQITNLSLLGSQCIGEDVCMLQTQGQECSLEGAHHPPLRRSSTQSNAEQLNGSFTLCTVEKRSNAHDMMHPLEIPEDSLSVSSSESTGVDDSFYHFSTDRLPSHSTPQEDIEVTCLKHLIAHQQSIMHSISTNLKLEESKVQVLEAENKDL